MALKERTHRAVRPHRSNDPYNPRTYKGKSFKGSAEQYLGQGPNKKKRKGKVIQDPFNETKFKENPNGITSKVISRTHIPKERVNQKEKMRHSKEVGS